MKVYLIDSNFLIQAHRAHYPLDIAVNFWKKIKELAEAGKIISIDKVKNELFGKNDDLEAWCRTNLPDNFFKTTDTEEIIEQYAQLSMWVYSKSDQYRDTAIAEFLDADEADAFLIAFAMADKPNRTIVTQETSAPNSKRKVKIPEPCHHFEVNYLNSIEMFRALGETF